MTSHALARVEAFGDFSSAASVWRRLANADVLATPYSRLEWLQAWHVAVGARQGCKPLIVVGYDEFNAPLFLLPFAYRRANGLTIARYFGGAHSQINLGLWRSDTATLPAETLQAAFAEVARRHAIDVFVLLNQPQAWRDADTPLLRLPHQRSPSDAYRASWTRRSGDAVIATKLTSSMRRRCRAKEKKLQQLAGYRYFQAATEAEADRLLDVFFAQKDQFFRSCGLPNPFADPGVMEFLRACCLRDLERGHPVIELHAIEGGGETLAVVGGTCDGERFSAMFNSLTINEAARWSPGLILILNLMRNCGDRGLTCLDYGVGYAPYKMFFCKEIEPLFDSFLGFSPRGRLAARAYSLAYGLKRAVKSNRLLWTLAQRARRLRGTSRARMPHAATG